MPSEDTLISLIIGFLLVATRIGAFFVFIPIPGARAFVGAPKIVLTVTVAVMLSRFWPLSPEIAHSFGGIVVAIAAEAALGLAAGTGVALITEATQLTGQLVGLQAGFSYASTIDPNSEADSGILLIFMQLLTSLIVFATGLDREILAALANSFEKIPPGTYRLTSARAMGVLSVGATMFQIGLRLASPVVATLLIADISLALLGKVEQHLQLSNLMFPLKMLVALAILSVVMAGSARILEQWLSSGWRTVLQAVGL